VQNCEVRGHTNPGVGSNDYRLHKHKQNESIDGVSSAFSQSDYDAMKSAAQQSQFAFDGAATTACGTWYSSLGAPWKQGYRELFQRL
jgi:hypothetical protein